MKKVEQEELAELQKKLAQQVFIPSQAESYIPQDNDLVYSLDIQYVGDKAFVAVDVQGWNQESYKTYVGVTVVEYEYVSQYFCFREGPPLQKVIQKVQEHTNSSANLLIVDGHGVAHPRRFGVACWLGTQLGKPTIGCAKRGLLRHEGEPEKKRGNQLGIYLEDEKVGVALITQNKIKPVFVSAGHKIHLQVATEVMLKLSSKYRVSEPIRRADQAARTYAKGQTLSGVHFFGEV